MHDNYACMLGLECVTDAARELGYPEMKVMKPEQLEVAANFIEGRDVFTFQFCLLAVLWQEFMLRLLASNV